MPRGRPAGPHWVLIPLALAAGGLAGLLLPWSKWAAALVPAAWVAALLSWLAGGLGWTHRLGAWLLAGRARAAVFVAFASSVTFVGGLAGSAQVAVRAGWVRPYEAMQTLLPAGVEDWRLAHITADIYREPDPVLFWRPRASAPYSAQRFKGPLAVCPRPAGVFRIMAYGDSNTDGPPQGGWPERLQAELERHGGSGWEVLNAGVVGYTSHQGLRRLRSESGVYEPNLVLASFGWNDAAPAVGPRDSGYAPPAPWRAALVRGLLRYHGYRVALRWLAGRAAARGQVQAGGPRVTLDEFADNLRAMVTTAGEAGARIVLLTRPVRAAEAELEALPGAWRAQVPAYNRTLRRVASERGVPMLDVSAWFSGRAEYFADECHFSGGGQAEMAQRLAVALDEAGLLVGAGGAPGAHPAGP